MKSFVFTSLLLSGSLSFAIMNGKTLISGRLPQVGTLQGNSHICTVTLVGNNAILTAAHCARAGVNLRADFNGTSYGVKFLAHPSLDTSYRPDLPGSFAVRHDLALGLLSQEVIGVPPITISFHRPSMSENILITGSGVPNRGVRQYGYMKTTKVSQFGLTLHGYPPFEQTGAKGDSGGGSFRVDSQGHVSLVAVNSSSNAGQDKSQAFGSFFGKPFTHGSTLVELSFLEQAATKLRANVCGVNQVCSPVRF